MTQVFFFRAFLTRLAGLFPGKPAKVRPVCLPCVLDYAFFQNGLFEYVGLVIGLGRG